MDREIKFRAWDKLKKRIQEVAGINFVEGIVILWKQTRTVRSTYYTELDSVELIQYTGLKDKNNKEIYEGDIIQPTSKERYVVVFNSGWFGFQDSFGGWFILADTFHTERMKYFEVIGNLFENPELIKMEK